MCCPITGELAHEDFYEANPEVNHEDVCKHAIREYYEYSDLSIFTFEFEPTPLGCYGTLSDEEGEPHRCFSLKVEELRKI
jgi:hypothetical protein